MVFVIYSILYPSCCVVVMVYKKSLYTLLWGGWRVDFLCMFDVHMSTLFNQSHWTQNIRTHTHSLNTIHVLCAPHTFCVCAFRFTVRCSVLVCAQVDKRGASQFFSFCTGPTLKLWRHNTNAKLYGKRIVARRNRTLLCSLTSRHFHHRNVKRDAMLGIETQTAHSYQMPYIIHSKLIDARFGAFVTSYILRLMSRLVV